MKPCVFFDRDGIVNASPGPGYVERWEDFVLLPGFVEALRVVTAAGYGAVLVTNQRGVARGIVPESEVQRIHAELQRVLREDHGLSLLDIRYCPHGDGVCRCRKPQPGMLLAAAVAHNLDLAQSWMVGDGERDIEAGRRAGCRTLRVCAPDTETTADARVSSVDALAPRLRQLLSSTTGT